jgi:hypothetical protein
MPDDRLNDYLACSAYPSDVNRFRTLPPDVQLAILNQGTPRPGQILLRRIGLPAGPAAVP